MWQHLLSLSTPEPEVVEEGASFANYIEISF